MRLRKIIATQEIDIKIDEVSKAIDSMKQEFFDIGMQVESIQNREEIMKTLNKMKKIDNELKKQEDLLGQLNVEKNQIVLEF